MGTFTATEMESYFDRLWPICRSITGNGLRESFAILSEIISLTLHEIPSGTTVFDWQVPQEWNIREAYIITPDGKRICDLKQNNLHVINYSEPVNGEFTWIELEPHLRSLPEQPSVIPYVTSYYKRQWGFCLSHDERQRLPREGKYKVVIDSSLSDGSLTLGDIVLPGKSEKEILFSTYLCHPSMANNELSGPLVTAFLYRELAAMKDRKYTYRFVIAPETIGSIAYLHRNGEQMKKNTLAGWVLTCCGTDDTLKYKRTVHEHSFTDLATAHILKKSGTNFQLRDFDPIGSDERQYSSPGFRLPVGSIMTSKYHEYPEYHTSADDKSLISFESMKTLIDLLAELVREIESTTFYRNTVAYGEPQLGKRGLYPSLELTTKFPDALRMRMRLLNFFDGTRSVIEFCGKYDYPESLVKEEIALLESAGLLQPIPVS